MRTRKCECETVLRLLAMVATLDTSEFVKALAFWNGMSGHYIEVRAHDEAPPLVVPTVESLGLTSG